MSLSLPMFDATVLPMTLPDLLRMAILSSLSLLLELVVVVVVSLSEMEVVVDFEGSTDGVGVGWRGG